MAPVATTRSHSLNDQCLENSDTYDVLIIGGGFSGIYNLHRLRKAGFKVKLVERGTDFGGTWYWSHYPGARVDSEVPLYELSLPEISQEWYWTERYPGWKEIQSYFENLERKLDLKRDCQFSTEFTGAEWDDTFNRWHATLVPNDSGAKERVSARFIVLCTGFAAKPYIPNFKGLDKFQGPKTHTSLWPKEDIDCAGKRVAVIGTGASGVQCIQEIGPMAKELIVFQRTPNLALPMQQHKMSRGTQDQYRPVYPAIFDQCLKTFSGFHFTWAEKTTFEDDEEAREKFYQQLFDHGGFRFWLANYKDLLNDQKANDVAYAFWQKKTAARIKDPQKRDLLAPKKPIHPFGTKRPSLEQNFYEICNQDNVKIVNTRAHPISEITQTGVKTDDGKEYEVDVLILATGFDTHTGGWKQLDICGLNGSTFKKKFASGTNTYLGMMTADFPNLMISYGAHGPTAFCNGPTCLQIQCNWICEVITDLKGKHDKIVPSAAAETAWKKHIVELSDASLFPLADSWYMGANVEGKPREPLNYTGGVSRYREEITDARVNGYKGFELS